MRSQCLQLSERFILLIPDVGPANARRTITYSYESEAELDAFDQPSKVTASSRRLRTAREVLASLVRGRGTEDYYAAIATRGPFGASSYHAEVLAPEDLTVVGARLRMATVLQFGDHEKRTEISELASDRSTPRVHLHASGRAAPQPDATNPSEIETATSCYIRIRLRLRTGLVVPVVIVAATVFAALTAGLAAHLAGYRPESSTVAAVLVALPALYAAYLIPQGHALMRRLFTGLRTMLIVLTLVAYAAAASLAIDLGHNFRYVLWASLDVVALFCLGIAVMAFGRAFRGALGPSKGGS